MATRIILLSDGTGNSASQVWRTNVWRTFESLDLTQSDQVAFYDDGVGTSSFKPLAFLGGAFGWGLKRNVIDIYKFACRNYRKGDEEFFGFGFSRGAFTMRVVAGLIMNQGLVRYTTEAELHSQSKAAYRAYRREKYHSVFRLERPFRWIRDIILRTSYDKLKNHPVPTIRFLGLWDTVAAYGLPMDEMTRGVSQWIWPLELPDRTLNPRVQRACHALALDDERTTFHPVLWNERREVLAKPDDKGNRHTKDERISQVWFTGMHSNVGGGYPDDSLAHIPLYWMMIEAQHCGLRFKHAPDAEPDAFLRMRSAGDKDGRLYDSRTGLGGYYRYGPRKLYDLSHARLSRKLEDEVEIALPKIHESVFKRIQNGAHLYAPIGFPAQYEVVTDDGRILSPDGNHYEKPAQALGRSQAQEHVWNIVWKRRLVYFLTVVVSLYLVIYPLFRNIPRAAEYSSPLRPLSDAIRLFGSFLPDTFSVWVTAYARSHGRFLLVVLVIAALISRGSNLKSRITDEMFRFWRSDLSSRQNALLPTNWIYRVRTHPVYQLSLRAVKRHIAPALFAATFIYIGGTFAIHVLFNLQDAAGLVCQDSITARGLAQNEKAEIRFKTSDICAASGVLLEEGGRYRLTVGQLTPWRDANIESGVGGFHFYDLRQSKPMVIFTLALPLKRALIRPWFRVIARVGNAGTDEEFLDPDPNAPAAYKLQEVIRARRSGELFFYVNDAVLAFPGMYDYFYRNNVGDALVTIERL